MGRADTESLISMLIARAISQQLIDEMDSVYIFNRVLNLFRQETATINMGSENNIADSHEKEMSIPDCLELLCDTAVEQGLIPDLTDLRDIFSTEIMNCFLDKPSVINRRFWELYSGDPVEATDWYYYLSRASNYIQTQRIERNIVYQADSQYGILDITINLSKPEKNPRDIAAARKQKKTSYPRCLLCVENEGFAGRIAYPARASHRLIRISLADEPWYLQYSPYSYYPEHCIVLSEKHVPMRINRTTFTRLIGFVAMFPHYFAGSNADLPIVGGSILSHDHYQGGRYEFAMNRAELEYDFVLPGYEDITCGIIRWPMSVIRLISENKEAMIDAVDFITRQWREYSDVKAQILARSDGEPHNTVTPIAYRRGKAFVFDLVLRNNRTSNEHPLGIFHPHADVHHIKKENIGLIEVMGLAVLPPRLADELKDVELFIQGRIDSVASAHREWAEDLRSGCGNISDRQARDIVRRAVAVKFKRVLMDAGVFKRDTTGQQAFRKFVSLLILLLA